MHPFGSIKGMALGRTVGRRVYDPGLEHMSLSKLCITLSFTIFLSLGDAAAQPEAVITNVPTPGLFTVIHTVGVDLQQRRLAWSTPSFGDDVVVTSDGRFAIWSGYAVDPQRPVLTYYVAVRDAMTGTTTRLPAPASVYRLLSHSRRLQVFALVQRAPIQAIDGNSQRSIDMRATR